jgi:hypothetical protein
MVTGPIQGGSASHGDEATPERSSAAPQRPQSAASLSLAMASAPPLGVPINLPIAPTSDLIVEINRRITKSQACAVALNRELCEATRKDFRNQRVASFFHSKEFTGLAANALAEVGVGVISGGISAAMAYVGDATLGAAITTSIFGYLLGSNLAGYVVPDRREPWITRNIGFLFNKQDREQYFGALKRYVTANLTMWKNGVFWGERRKAILEKAGSAYIADAQRSANKVARLSKRHDALPNVIQKCWWDRSVTIQSYLTVNLDRLGLVPTEIPPFAERPLPVVDEALKVAAPDNVEALKLIGKNEREYLEQIRGTYNSVEGKRYELERGWFSSTGPFLYVEKAGFGVLVGFMTSIAIVDSLKKIVDVVPSWLSIPFTTVMSVAGGLVFGFGSFRKDIFMQFKDHLRGNHRESSALREKIGTEVKELGGSAADVTVVAQRAAKRYDTIRVALHGEVRRHKEFLEGLDFDIEQIESQLRRQKRAAVDAKVLTEISADS